jgi:acyl-CoA thioester hydrolase
VDSVYRFEIEVTNDMLDRNRHVNNVAYVQWMQDAAVQHAETSGCTRLTMAAGATWVARHHHIEYLCPARAGDTLEVLTWVSNMRRVRSLRKYKFLRVSDHTVMAQGETDWVFVDAQTGRPRAIPRGIQDAFRIVAPGEEPLVGSK